MHDLGRALSVVRAVAAASQGDRALLDVLHEVCRQVATSLGLAQVGISRTEERPDGLVAVGLTAFGTYEEQARLEMRVDETPMLTRACETRSLVYIADAGSEPALSPELVEILGVTSVFVLPLMSEERCVGFLAGDRGGLEFRLDESERDLLNTIGVVVATLLEKELLREEARRLDAAKTQFIAFASHELRTPVQAVYGVLATLHHRGSELEQQQLRHLRATAFAQADRLRHLVDQLLDLSRLDGGALSLRPASTHIRSLVEEVVLLVAQQRAVDVEVAVRDDLEAVLDRGAVDRILSNLLGNALRYGAPPVRIEAEQNDRHIRLRVLDAGPGVDTRFVPQLFDRFTRINQSGSTPEGSGLGLAIARSYARAHGGDVLYRPNEPHGACFELVIPADAS